MFDDQILNAIAICSGFVWLGFSMLLGYNVAKFEVRFRREVAEREAMRASYAKTRAELDRCERAAVL